jgi:hypothetical protein
MKDIQYIVHRGADGVAEELFRFWNDGNKFSAEYFDEGEWIYHPPLMDILRELHNPAYDEVTEEEAAKIAQSLGGSI